MQGTWKTTSGGTGIGSAALAIGAAIGVVAVAPLLIAAVVAIVKALVIAAVALAVAVMVVTAAVWRLRSRRPVRELPVRRPLPQVQAQPMPAIEAPQALHLHFHGVDAEDVAAILREHDAR